MEVEFGDVLTDENGNQAIVSLIAVESNKCYAISSSILESYINKNGQVVGQVVKKDKGVCFIELFSSTPRQTFHIKFPDQDLKYKHYEIVFKTPESGIIKHPTTFGYFYDDSHIAMVITKETAYLISRSSRGILLNCVDEDESFPIGQYAFMNYGNYPIFYLFHCSKELFKNCSW